MPASRKGNSFLLRPSFRARVRNGESAHGHVPNKPITSVWISPTWKKNNTSSYKGHGSHSDLGSMMQYIASSDTAQPWQTAFPDQGRCSENSAVQTDPWSSQAHADRDGELLTEYSSLKNWGSYWVSLDSSAADLIFEAFLNRKSPLLPHALLKKPHKTQEAQLKSSF